MMHNIAMAAVILGLVLGEPLAGGLALYLIMRWTRRQ